MRPTRMTKVHGILHSRHAIERIVRSNIVIVENQPNRRRRGLVMTLVPVNVPQQQPLDARAKNPVLDIPPQTVTGLNRQPLAPQGIDQIRVLVHVRIQSVIRESGCFQGKCFPDQVGYHAAEFPAVIGITFVGIDRVEKTVGPVPVVRVFIGQSRQQDTPLAGITRVARQQPRLGKRAQGRNDHRSIDQVGIFPQEIVCLAAAPIPVAVVRTLPRREVALEVVVARPPFPAEFAANLVRMIERIDLVAAPGIEPPQGLSVLGTQGLVLPGDMTGNLRGGHQHPHEVVRSFNKLVGRAVFGTVVVLDRVAFPDSRKLFAGPVVCFHVRLRDGDPLLRVIGRSLLGPPPWRCRNHTHHSEHRNGHGPPRQRDAQRPRSRASGSCPDVRVDVMGNEKKAAAFFHATRSRSLSDTSRHSRRIRAGGT